MLREIVQHPVGVGSGYESDMPGFEAVLADAEIEAILDYIKSTWPDRERAFQSRVPEADGG